VDPHTAVGLHVAAQNRGDPAVPLVTLATAHPAKFPDAVERATGRRPKLPTRLAGLMEQPERVSVLPNDLTAVEAFVRARARMSR
jgi:threonine synthase